MTLTTLCQYPQEFFQIFLVRCFSGTKGPLNKMKFLHLHFVLPGATSLSHKPCDADIPVGRAKLDFPLARSYGAFEMVPPLLGD